MPPAPLYSDPLLMEAKMDQYFADREADKKPPTVAGLCFFLGFESRQSFLDYEKREAFSCTIKKARLRIEMDRAERLVSSGTPTAGVIFDLTNNHGWKNPQHILYLFYLPSSLAAYRLPFSAVANVIYLPR